MTVDINKVDEEGLRIYDDDGNYIPKGLRNPSNKIKEWVSDVQFKKIKKDLSECRRLQEKLSVASEEEEESWKSYREDAKKLKDLGFYDQEKIVRKMADDEHRHSEQLKIISRQVDWMIMEALGYP